MSAKDMTRVRAAASSIASGMPSRSLQMDSRMVGSTAARSTSGAANRARSRKSSPVIGTRQWLQLPDALAGQVERLAACGKEPHLGTGAEHFPR
jgi:hypothetical protein